MRIVLPAPVASRAAEVASGREPAVPLSPASTVVLLRRGSGGGLEAYLQRRHTGLAFAGGMYAFPGGRVDAADATFPDVLWRGPSPTEVGARLADADPEQARAHVVAVVRELFEETGVLLATPQPGADGSRQPSESDRSAVSGGAALADVLDDLSYRLDATLLRPWAQWLTPRFERRRFDTWFFVAALPPGQQPRVATEESHEGRWVSPLAAVGEMRAGRLPMLPPTWWTLHELAAFADVESVLASESSVLRYTVGWAREGDDAVMVLPDDPRYPGDDPREGT